MTTPLRIGFDVACPVEHAFRIWTSKISTWWPKDHTVTGRSDVSVILQNEVGGRIYERTADGREHDWGRVTRWEPPTHLSYLWHLGRDLSDATEVDIRFLPRGDKATRIEIEHHGWERLGAAADQWRDHNSAGWQTLLPHFLTAITTTFTKPRQLLPETESAMTVTRVIRYTTKPERADDNERLIRGVFSELATEKPGGLRYTVLRLQDGVSFIHVATIEGDVNPLTSSAAFKQFQEGIAERCAEGPTPAEATVIGSYTAS